MAVEAIKDTSSTGSMGDYARATSRLNPPARWYPDCWPPTPAVDLPIEPHALGFFHQSAPQLAGYFEHSLFQGSALQLSLAEATVRQAISALGLLHKQAALDQLQSPRRGTRPPELPMKLYNRAIRAIIKVTADPHNLPFIAMINILFTCFEYFQGNLDAAASHIRGGVSLLKDWRRKNWKDTGQAWGRENAPSEAEFMENEIAPLLSIFNISAMKWGVGMRDNLLLSPLDNQGKPAIPDDLNPLVRREPHSWT
ncbi:hypothetical protein N7532_008564 [Penicillium argentinense]|uniref:Uncharacterized protein n=1 Tax=Penicillium argentinense TaxID=1131581 RepID=A0A9W9K207_9EURO|nr:uncharacterized protein N7532_008564 [Penicillium argentinense]KAJ5089880.1 hypothetical protein N7532_008564 [Penicillium argentinense]